MVQVRKEFSDDVILVRADLTIARGEKVALVGRNGAGKTTLFKILMGQYPPDGGSVDWERGASVGYLSQIHAVTPGRTVLDEAESARAHVTAMRDRLAELEEIMEGTPSAEDLDEFSLLHEHFHSAGGYSIESDLRVVLQRMGFDESEFSKPTEKLSGGEKTRLSLAKLLLEEPDLLILDEPTNHLDLDATEWLERWIQGYHGAVLLVSHDRTFLSNVAARIVELRDGETKSYPAGFEKYLRLRAEDEMRLAALAKKQQDQMAKLDEYVRRFMNSQRTAQARGRLKQLEKLQASAVETTKQGKQMAGGFQLMKRAGDLIFETKGLVHRFEERSFFHGLDWTVRWGDRWGVIGVNGAGKSTLMRLLMGRMDPSEGSVRMGSHVALGYFSQDATDLDPELSPMEYLNEALRMELGEARSLLGRFLISGDDATRPIKTLSGGERNKLQLAVLTALHPNVLILDEPTNHLDMESREALAEVLREFSGTLIIVSHDRWLLNQCATQILDIREDRTVQYPGTYDEYRRKQSRPVEAAQTQARTMDSVEDGWTPRELSKEIGRMEKAVSQAEQAVETADQALQTLEAQMSAPKEGDDLYEMGQEYERLKAASDQAATNWEELFMRLEELQEAQKRQGRKT